jgi:mannose-binding lectin 1
LGKVNLPVGNNFGITAATPENPDSFEIFKFLLASATGQGQSAPSYQGSAQQQQQQQQPIANQDQPPVIRDTGNPVVDAGIGAQFVDLQGRIQLQNKATNTIIQDLKAYVGKSDSRHTELMQKLASKEQVAALDARLQRIESLLQNIQRDLEGKDYSSRFNQLHDTLRSSHLSLTESLQSHFLSGKSPLPMILVLKSKQLTSFLAITASSPRMGFFIFLVIAFQVLLATSYIIYKRRRANMPKKFL